MITSKKNNKNIFISLLLYYSLNAYMFVFFDRQTDCEYLRWDLVSKLGKLKFAFFKYRLTIIFLKRLSEIATNLTTPKIS